MKNGSIDFTGDIAYSIDRYLQIQDFLGEKYIKNNIRKIKPSLHISKIEINGTEMTNSTISSEQKSLIVTIDGRTDEEMTYDVMVILKNAVGIPMATFAPGHYFGDIKHQSIGEFHITREIELPKILSRGVISVDLFIHHPMVEYIMQAQNCATMDVDGYQEGFGKALAQNENGLIGLDYFRE